MKTYLVFQGNNTFTKVQAENYDDAYSKVPGYLATVSSSWKTLYSKYYKLITHIKKYDLDYIREQLDIQLDYQYTTINGEFISIDDVLTIDFIYLHQEGEEFTLPIQFLTDEQLYKLVNYLIRIKEVL